MHLTLELSDEEAFRLEALAVTHGGDVAQVAHDVLTTHLLQVQMPNQTPFSDMILLWNSEDAAAAEDPQTSTGLADWERLKGDLEANRLDLRVPKMP